MPLLVGASPHTPSKKLVKQSLRAPRAGGQFRAPHPAAIEGGTPMLPRISAGMRRIRSPHPRIRIRYARVGQGELEFEAFDPSPPAPNTVLLTRFAFGSARLSALHR